MKKILAFLLAAMLLLSIVGCAAQTQSDAQPAAAEPAADTSQPTQDSVSAADGDTVTIGYYLPLSGANATYSPYYLNAINLAIKKINAEPIREEKKKDNFVIYIIISGVILLLIISLLIVRSLKKRKNNVTYCK